MKLLFLVLTIGIWSMPTYGEPSTTEKTNIIYILADDLGYGDLGCYGQKDILTPHIDSLAKEGMRFTQHYSGSTVCAPSRSVLMTGLHTGHTYIRGNKAINLPASCLTVAEVMKSAGYVTGIIGKWGLGKTESEGSPNNQGFDHFFGYISQVKAHSYYPEYLWRNNKKVMLEGNKIKEGKHYSHDLLATESLDFIRKNKDKPFFLYIPFTIPHIKFQVPDVAPYKDKKWSKEQIIQAAMITRMDRDIGRIISLLKELKIDEKTLVIFTSDNGPHGFAGTLDKFKAAGKLKGKKRSLYEGGIRVPMVARWPSKIQPGSVSHHVSAFWDFLPTCAEIAGQKIPVGIDGLSMLPTLTGEKGQKEHDYLYWEFHEQGGKQAIRKGNWKAIRLNVAADRDGPLELYDLTKDISENNNVADDHPQIVKQMTTLLKNARTESEHFKFTKGKKKTKKKKKK